MHPGKKNSLDALCSRYEIDNAHRTLHGALLDTELLAEVYFAMTRGQESLLGDETQHGAQTGSVRATMRRAPAPRVAAERRRACRACATTRRHRQGEQGSLLVEETG